MKKLILIFITIISFFSFGENFRKIQVKGTSEIKITPYKSSIQLEILTKNKDLKKATEINNKLFEKYKNLLELENISYKNINSVDFFSNKEYNYENKVINKGIKEYETLLKIDIKSIENNLLEKIILILENHKIYSIKKNINNSYGFEIKIRNKNELNAKKMAYIEFENIKEKLLKIGVPSSDIVISGLENNTFSLEKIEKVKIDIYNVLHKFQINTTDLNNLGKIIDLANTLNINTPNYIEYHFNNEKIERNLYNEAFNSAYKKAEKMAKSNDLNLKNPLNIIDKSMEISNINNYFKNKYNNYYESKISTEEYLNKDYNTIKNEINENNTIIVSRKQIITKELFIEFEVE